MLVTSSHFGKEAIIRDFSNWIPAARRRDSTQVAFSPHRGNAKAGSKLPSVSASRSQILATGQGDKPGSPGDLLGTARLSETAPALPGSLPQRLQRRAERHLLTQSCYTRVRLCFCHLDSEQIQITKKKKKENMCRKGSTTPPREGMQQWEPRVWARPAQPPEAGWAPEDLTLTPQPWISKMV